MRFPTLTALLATGTLLFTVGVSDAHAKKNKGSSDEPALVEIEATNTSADEVFMAAKEIHDALNDIQTHLKDGTTELNNALGLAEGTPFADALADLQAKAGDKLTVALEGGKPTFSLADDAPDDVKTAVDSLNRFVEYHMTALDEAKALVPKAQEVAQKAQGLDAAGLAGEAASNPLEIGKLAKSIGRNIKAVGQTPKRVEDTIAVLSGDIEAVSALAN
ncbi:MAG: hypothetical protein D6798_07535 [Deltaproteobacteria bacterium]|nr:MAG: hypothetical protein D6798_07535 [Deltaproteobacteria bacterium]